MPNHFRQARIDLTQAEVTTFSVTTKKASSSPENVLNLYTKIIEDTRHQRCKLVSIDLSDKRIFESCSMGYISLTDTKMQQLRHELPAKINHDNTDKFIMNLRGFLNNAEPKAVI